LNPLTLNDITSNAFRILGLTADASQEQADAAARKMRIWQDPSMIPPTANDAAWMGPISRTRQSVENAVARLADPLTRLPERFWWFCLPPPASDAPPADSPRGSASDPTGVRAFHDAALVHLYRSLLTDVSGENLPVWQSIIHRFEKLADSDDYLQWLLEVESAGDFEKRARPDEIAEAQQELSHRLATAVTGSVAEALDSGDFDAAVKAVQLITTKQNAGPKPPRDPPTSPRGISPGSRASANPRAASSDPAEKLLDRLEENLAKRCNELTAKIDAAWETRRVAQLRPACNHAANRFDVVIQPMIDQLISTTQDIDRQNRACMIGVELLVHISRAYDAFENFLASQRVLEIAADLATGTPMEPSVNFMLEQVQIFAQRQRAGIARGQRRKENPPFKKSGE
jgi:hypothetical protein